MLEAIRGRITNQTTMSDNRTVNNINDNTQPQQEPRKRFESEEEYWRYVDSLDKK